MHQSSTGVAGRAGECYTARVITALALLAACTATDGDTIRCGGERVRIAGIDAPELKRCPRTRVCVPGDGQASKRALASMIAGRELTIVRTGRDRYGRTLARVYAGGRNVACELIAGGFAVRRYDRRATKECRR